MLASNSQLQKIGKRIKSGKRLTEDLDRIVDHRDSRIPELIATLSDVTEHLASESIPFLISGRPKRLKSIIRKLERSSGTNLARMADIIGMRLVVHNINIQNQVVSHLSNTQKLSRDILDRRSEEMYRAVHLYVEGENGAIELQVRTLPQQLWAIESEQFGEQVKEGIYSPDQLEYLTELAECCNKIDYGEKVDSMNSTLGINRGAMTGILPLLEQNFRTGVSNLQHIKNYLITYDKFTRAQLRIDRFKANEQQSVTNEFKRLTKILDEGRYDILLLNANSSGCLRVTHPNYFPLA